VEKKLVELWAELLVIEPAALGIDDNFFQLGGHSLNATILVSKIKKNLNIDLPLVELFSKATIRSMAEKIAATTPASTGTDIPILLRQGSQSTNLFLVHDGTGEVEGYLELTRHLDPAFNCWGIRAERMSDLAPRNITIPGLAQTYIDKIKTVQPQGPYNILGWSLGGTIAFEMVRQLEQAGEKITFLALADSPPPEETTSNVQFNRQSELDYLKNYPFYDDIIDRLKPINRLDLFWVEVVKYLEASPYSLEEIKKTITVVDMHVLPDSQSLDSIIYYLNLGRTLYNARENYTPPTKIHTPVHYFAANQSIEIRERQWNHFTQTAIETYDIPGDHYSIFELPSVKTMADTIGRIYRVVK
jgi:thioesterase domain-containing protein/acyl carrier protein